MTFLVKINLTKLAPRIQVVSINSEESKLSYTYRWMGDITGYDIANNLIIGTDYFGRVWKFYNPNFEKQENQSYKLMPYFDTSKNKFVTAVVSDKNNESFIKSVSIFWNSPQNANDIFRNRNSLILFNQLLSITKGGYIK